MTPSQRLAAALQSDVPAQAVAALAHALRDEGMGQAALYRLYLQAHQMHSDSDMLYDALADTMDLIWGGGWAKGRALFAQVLSMARLDQEQDQG